MHLPRCLLLGAGDCSGAKTGETRCGGDNLQAAPQLNNAQPTQRKVVYQHGDSAQCFTGV